MHNAALVCVVHGGGAQITTLVESSAVAQPFDDNLLELHAALEGLAALDSRAAQAIELRYFGGLTEREAAEVLGISVATLKRDWEAGRAWLVDRLGWGQRNETGKIVPHSALVVIKATRSRVRGTRTEGCSFIA